MAEEPAGGENNAQIIKMMEDAVAAGKVKLVCSGKSNIIITSGRKFDRALDLQCNPWTWEDLAQFTVVSLTGVPSNKPGYQSQDAPGLDFLAISALWCSDFECRSHNATFAQHTHWFLSYENNALDHSTYTWGWGSTNPDAVNPIATAQDLLRLVVLCTPFEPIHFLESYVMIPLLGLVFRILKLCGAEMVWFDVWPVALLFGIIGGIFASLVVGGFLYVKKLRAAYPERPGYVVGKSGRPLCIELGSWFVIWSTVLGTLCALSELARPGVIYCLNKMDRKLALKHFPRGDKDRFIGMVVGTAILLTLAASSAGCWSLANRAQKNYLKNLAKESRSNPPEAKIPKFATATKSELEPILSE